MGDERYNLPPKKINGKHNMCYYELKIRWLLRDLQAAEYNLKKQSHSNEHHRQWGSNLKKENEKLQRVNQCLKKQLEGAKNIIRKREYSYKNKCREYNNLKIENASLKATNISLVEGKQSMQHELQKSESMNKQLNNLVNKLTGFDCTLFEFDDFDSNGEENDENDKNKNQMNVDSNNSSESPSI